MVQIPPPLPIEKCYNDCMTIPTATTPGYGIYVGLNKDGHERKFVACNCLITWLPVLNSLLLFKRLVKTRPLWVEQLTGSEAESAGTHEQGGVFDLGYSSKAIAIICREMGAPATWVRYMPLFEIDHTHGVLNNCPHNAPAAYQLKEQLAGGDGLKGTAPDPLKGYPKVYRTWQQGINYARGVMSPTAFQLKMLKMETTDPEVAKFQKWLWSKQPADYKTWFKNLVYDFDKYGFTNYYGKATARMVADTYKRLDKQYPDKNWDYGVVNNVWPDEPGTMFIKFFGGTVYI